MRGPLVCNIAKRYFNAWATNGNSHCLQWAVVVTKKILLPVNEIRAIARSQKKRFNFGKPPERWSHKYLWPTTDTLTHNQKSKIYIKKIHPYVWK